MSNDLKKHLRFDSFRRGGSSIRNTCKRFVGLCRELKLFTQSIVTIDGSKFKSVNNWERNHTQGKIERRERELEKNSLH
jgi:transposase